MKVIHLLNDAVLGRYPLEWVTEEFAKHGVSFHRACASTWLYKRGSRTPALMDMLNEKGFDWLYWGWECESPKVYRSIFENPRRQFKVFIYGQEQPQRLDAMRAVYPYCDMGITSSPVWAEEVDGFLPFGIHTRYCSYEPPPWGAKKNQILLTGSYRHSRCQLFERLLYEQPFEWPVVMFPPNLYSDHAGGDRFRQVAARYPKYVLGHGGNHTQYIPGMLRHLGESKIHIDFTTNSSNWMKFHEDYLEVMKQSAHLRGGYCPERVLDAAFMRCHSICLYDKALKAVAGDNVSYYHSYDELVHMVNRMIRSLDSEQVERERNNLYPRFSTENIIRAMALMFKTGRPAEV